MSKKILVFLLLLAVVISSSFAQVSLSADGTAKLGAETNSIFKGTGSILFFVGLCVGTLGLMFLGISTMLGITIGEKLKATLFRIFGGLAIVCAAGYIPSILGQSDVTGGAKGAITAMSIEAFKMMVLAL